MGGTRHAMVLIFTSTLWPSPQFRETGISSHNCTFSWNHTPAGCWMTRGITRTKNQEMMLSGILQLDKPLYEEFWVGLRLLVARLLQTRVGAERPFSLEMISQFQMSIFGIQRKQQNFVHR
jgi:hypothetical protein